MQNFSLHAQPPESTMFTKDDTLLAKAAAVLFMLVHHLFGFPYRVAPGNAYVSMFSLRGSPVEYLFGVFGGVCVTMFMLLSGYGTYLKLCKVPARLLAQKAGQKLLRVYKSVWGVFAVFIPLGFALRADNIVLEPGTFLLNLLGLNLTYNEEWWFLTPFLVLTLFSPLLVMWLRNKASVVWVDTLNILTLVLLVEPFLRWIYTQESLVWLTGTLLFKIFATALNYLPSFFMGCLLAKYNLFARIRMLIQSRVILSACSVGWLAFVLWEVPKMGTLLELISTPLLVFACVTLLRDIPIVRPMMLAIGKQSTGIWLIHSFFCYYYFQRLTYLPRYSPLIFLWLLVLSFAAAWGINWFWHSVGRGVATAEKKLRASKKPAPPLQ